MGSRTDPRVVGEADAARAAEIFALAFNQDPVWGWAFPEEERRLAQQTVWWRFCVDSALEHGWVWLSGDGGAAALWIPPGRPEISEELEPLVEPLLIEHVGETQAQVLLEVFDRFDAAHPREQPHYYLSLLGTHPDSRGRGLGMDLLADCLEAIDTDGIPAYLESSNPGNNHRYERHGFTKVGEFPLPGDGPSVTTMWREARAGAGSPG